MNGVITFKHVFLNAHIVVHEFGWLVLARCVYAVLTHQHRTFLSIVFAK